MPVRHLIIGSRPGESGIVQRLRRLLRDILRFMLVVKKEEYDIVHLNPSLDPKSLLRDGLFVLMAKFSGSKVLVFFRGWHYEKEIHTYWRWLFKSIFGRADAFIVLSRAFKSSLSAWITDKPVYCEFTALDDNDLIGFDFDKTLDRRLTGGPWQIVFMSRLIKEKGLYETIDAVRLLSQEGLPVSLVIAGDGPEFEPAKGHVALHGPPNVRFLGYMQGEEKQRILRESHLLCFPTYGEGMPNVVIEAMGFGLPIVTRPVGGLVDFFENGTHGLVTPSKDPLVFAHLIRQILSDPVKYRQMALTNYRYAQKHFKATQSAMRLEKIYKLLSEPLRSGKRIASEKMPPAATV